MTLLRRWGVDYDVYTTNFSSPLNTTFVDTNNYTESMMDEGQNTSLHCNYSSISEYEYEYTFDYGAFLDWFIVKLDRFLALYFSVFIFVLALVGNAIICCVLGQKKTRNFSTSIFMINLAVAEWILGFAELESWLIYNRYINRGYSDIDCQLRGLITRASVYISRLLLASLSIERAFCVRIPHKVKSICTVKFARCLVFAIWIVSILKAGLYSFLLEYDDSILNTPNCFVRFNDYEMLYWVDLCLYILMSVIIPFSIIIICTVIIVVSLVNNAMRRTKSRRNQVRSVTLTLLIVDIIFLVLNGPSVCYDLYFIVQVYLMDYQWFSIESYLQHIVSLNIMLSVNKISTAVNFFIYFFTGSKFRQETKDYFLCSRKKYR